MRINAADTRKHVFETGVVKFELQPLTKFLMDVEESKHARDKLAISE